MILIGENINVMSQTIGPAMKARDPQPLLEMARAENAVDVDYLDLNIGPARKAGDEMMTWVVQTVRQVCKKPLSLDTTNDIALEAGLKIHGNSPALINSVSLSRAEVGLSLVQKYNADMIGLLWGLEGMPRDANERAMIAVDLIYKANQAGIPNERIWIDPVVSPVSVEINQVKSCVEFMGMLKDIAPGCKSTVGVSNISNGTPTNLRHWLNRVYLIMLMRAGLYSSIINAFDEEMIQIARGKRPEIVALVYSVMDGKKVDFASLSDDEIKYVKTARVLLGETLYSHSWLEV